MKGVEYCEFDGEEWKIFALKTKSQLHLFHSKLIFSIGKVRFFLSQNHSTSENHETSAKSGRSGNNTKKIKVSCLGPSFFSNFVQIKVIYIKLSNAPKVLLNFGWTWPWERQFSLRDVTIKMQRTLEFLSQVHPL